MEESYGSPYSSSSSPWSVASSSTSCDTTDDELQQMVLLTTGSRTLGKRKMSMNDEVLDMSILSPEEHKAIKKMLEKQKKGQGRTHAAMVSLDQSHDLIRSIIAKDNTSVKDMRRIISKMRALVYRDEDECRGKKKPKHQWDIRPDNWPEHIPFVDPNNGDKTVSAEKRAGSRPQKEKLHLMFDFLKGQYLEKYEEQKTLHHPTEEQDHNCQYAIAAEVVPLFPVKEKDDNLEMAVHQKCQDLGDEDFPGLSVMVDNVRKVIKACSKQNLDPYPDAAEALGLTYQQNSKQEDWSKLYNNCQAFLNKWGPSACLPDVMATSTTPAAVQGSMELSCTEVEDKPQGLEMDSFEAIERLAQSFTLPPSLVVQNACVKPEEGSYNMEKKPVIPEATEKLGIAIRNPPIPTVTKNMNKQEWDMKQKHANHTTGSDQNYTYDIEMEQECDLDDILDLQEAITERTKLNNTTLSNDDAECIQKGHYDIAGGDSMNGTTGMETYVDVGVGITEDEPSLAYFARMPQQLIQFAFVHGMDVEDSSPLDNFAEMQY